MARSDRYRGVPCSRGSAGPARWEGSAAASLAGTADVRTTKGLQPGRVPAAPGAPMKYFAALAFVFGLALLVDAVRASNALVHEMPEATIEASGWSTRMIVAWASMVVGMNVFIIALLRESRSQSGDSA